MCLCPLNMCVVLRLIRKLSYKSKMDVPQIHKQQKCTFSNCTACVCYFNNWTDWSALGCFSPWIWPLLVGEGFFFLLKPCLYPPALIIWPGELSIPLLWVQIRLKVRSTVRAKSILLSWSTLVWVVSQYWFHHRSNLSCTFWPAIFAV